MMKLEKWCFLSPHDSLRDFLPRLLRGYLDGEPTELTPQQFATYEPTTRTYVLKDGRAFQLGTPAADYLEFAARGGADVVEMTHEESQKLPRPSGRPQDACENDTMSG